MSCDLGHRRGSDLALLWLCHTLVATAPIRPLAWEPPHATGATLKRQKKKSKSKSLDILFHLQCNKNIACITFNMENIMSSISRIIVLRASYAL